MTWKEHLQISRRALKKCFALDRKFTVCLILGAFLDAAAGYIPIYFSARLIDALVSRAPLKEAVKYGLLTVGIAFGLRLLNRFITTTRDVYRSMMYQKERWSYSEKAMEMAYTSVEDPEVTRLKYRIRKESQTGYNWYYLLNGLERLIGDITSILASLALTVSFFTLPSLSAAVKLALIAGLALMLIVSIRQTARIEKLEQDFWTASVEMNVYGEQFSRYTDDYGSGKDIRLYGMKDYLADKILHCDAAYYDMGVKKAYRQALYTLPGTLLSNLFQYGVYAILIYTALSGQITVGSIAKYVACITLLIQAVLDMVRVLQRMFQNHHYLKRYFSYFDIPNRMYRGTLTVEKRDDNDYQVEFRNVSFHYPNTEGYALKNVSLTFQIGEKLALVGQNGSGKTTFIKLLCRLYDPTEGEILLNGVDIRKYDYEEYMSLFSVVFQDFNLFPFQLGQVVASGETFDSRRVRECLEKANFGDRLTEFPQGEETFLYKNYEKSGVEISGGEAQKIALARALYKDAPFILLDEPTAALDPVSEYEVYSNFNAISGDKTTVYISHRLASCRFCQKIAVFDGGKIVQTGSHESLVCDMAGKYYELWTAQAQYYGHGSAEAALSL